MSKSIFDTENDFDEQDLNDLNIYFKLLKTSIDTNGTDYVSQPLKEINKMLKIFFEGLNETSYSTIIE